MLIGNLSSAAKALNGSIVSGAIIAPGPGHSSLDRSLSIRFSTSAPGGFVVHSFAGDDPIACRDYVRACLGLRHDDRLMPVMERNREPSNDNGELARRIWQEAREPFDSPVPAYLTSRSVQLPPGAAGRAIRFHPLCPFGSFRVPAMIALVVDIASNTPIGIHRTYVGRDNAGHSGTSARVPPVSRLSLGPCAGGAVKLSPDEDVTNCLGIGEGIETTLSLRGLPEFGPSPVWSLLNAGNLAAFPTLAGVECLWIAEDHDPAGINAARATSERWHSSGAEAFRIRAIEPKADLNDIVKGVQHG